MAKPRNLLLTAVLFFLAFALIMVEEEAVQGGIIEKEAIIEEIQEEIIREIENEEFEEYQELSWQWIARQKKIFQLGSGEINLILKEVRQRFPDKDERLKALAILRLGTPYQLGCLGEEKGEDKDPIFRLDVTDCTAFILTTVALLHSDAIEDARGMMKFLNYRSEEIVFESRLHFTTDRNEVSPYFEDITQEVIQTNEIGQKKVILNKIKEDGKRLINIDWEKAITLSYVSHNHITREFLQGLPKTAGIAFIRENDAAIGLDVAHEGILFNRETLIHASLAQGKVIKENFLDYYFADQKIPKFEGVVLFEIN